MCQGDCLSPTLFSLHINDDELHALNCGFDMDGTNVSCFLHADDLILITENEVHLQSQRNVSGP